MSNSRPGNILLKIIILLAISSAIHLTLFICVATSEIKPDKTYFCKEYKDYLNNNNDADILVIGNSKALSSLSSDVLYSETNKKAYNMSYSGANIEFSRNLLNSYLSNTRHKPLMCILEVSWFSLSTLRTTYPHDKPQIDLKIGDVKQIINSIRHNRADLVKNIVKRISNKDTAYVDWWDGDPKKAGMVFDPDKFNIDEMHKIFPTLEAGVDSRLLKSYYDIISICKNNNIELILYTAPEAAVFTKNQKDRDIVKNIFIKSVRDNNLVYLDFTVEGKYYSRQLDDMLYDSHHIRRTEDFTKLFLATLKKQKLENNAPGAQGALSW
jgi:hypothetical protein